MNQKIQSYLPERFPVLSKRNSFSMLNYRREFYVICGKMLLLYIIILLATITENNAAETKTTIMQKGKLIAYWRFNENKGKITNDSSAHKHQGRIINVGTYARWSRGKSGYAIEFTGKGKTKNGGLEIRRMPKKFPHGLTISFWVKLNETCKPTGVHEFISNAFKENGPGFRFVLFYNSFLWRTGNGEKIKQIYSAREKVYIPRGEWFHLAVITDNKFAAIYFNGMKVAVAKETLIPIAGNDTWYIGSYRWGYAYPLNGIMDEIKVFDYALSEKDILEEYNNSR